MRLQFWALATLFFILSAAGQSVSTGENDSSPDKRGASLRQANEAYEAGDYGRAERMYRELLRQNPDNAQALFNLGNALVRQNKTEEATEAYRQYLIRADDPEQQAPGHYNLGYLHGQTGENEHAMENFRQSLQRNPHDEDAKFNYELIRRRLMQQEPEPPEQDPSQQPPPPRQQPEGMEDQMPASPEFEEQPPSDESPSPPPEITQEQLEHAEDIMNALEQIEKELIKDFKRRQHDPADPREKDW